ncbi:hypothetical protein TNIN_317281 [Trichonephila inaurata madagascariensis]|uniref:Uncharacterized protein n=1 Tax=Trichonephila inaurata madagascariensis TaxID=2747483 RepID=A0A8X6MDX9_9ARAC|nr:hypothetical protein TNIN_317281 [Trichonephila inaurata madagascariensis]
MDLMLGNSDHSSKPIIDIDETQPPYFNIPESKNTMSNSKGRKRLKSKVEYLLDMEFEALELEIKYFLLFLRNLIRAKKKESLELGRDVKIPPKSFYDYVHNPPDSVYVFVAVCIIVIFVLGLGIYLLYFFWGMYFKLRIKQKLDQENSYKMLQNLKVQEGATKGKESAPKSQSLHRYTDLKEKFKKNYKHKKEGSSPERLRIADVKNKIASFCKRTPERFRIADLKNKLASFSKKSAEKFHVADLKNKTASFSKKSPEKFQVADLKNKLASFSKGRGSNVLENHELKHDRYGVKDAESLEDVISRVSKLESYASNLKEYKAHKSRLKQNLVKTGDTRIDIRLTPDEYTKHCRRF